MTRLTSSCLVALLLTPAACGGDDTTGTGTETTVTATDPTTDGSSGSPTTDPTAETSASTTEDPTATTTAESSSTGADGSTGSSSTGADESSSGDSSTGAACQPITEDTSAIGQVCEGVADCPEGYGCYTLGGFNPQPYCHIPCAMDCECPDGLSCYNPTGQSKALACLTP